MGRKIIVKFNIILEPADEGGFNVTVPALDGCYTQGETEKEALENAREAIICYLEGLEKVNQIRTAPQAIMKTGITIDELKNLI
jgi:predicted RNase H-like HicB family nuclease